MMASICMAVYVPEDESKNSLLPLLRRQITSIIDQMSEEDELVISDNGSGRTTKLFLESIEKNNRIRIIQYSEHKSARLNFANAMSVIREESKIVVLSDQDDLWIENKLMYIKSALRGKGRTLFLSNSEAIDLNTNRKIYHSFFDFRKVKKGFKRNLWWKNSYKGCCMAFTTDLLSFVLPIPGHRKIFGVLDEWYHDQWIGLISEKYGRVIFNDSILTSETVHDQNLTKGWNFKRRKIRRMIVDRISLYLSLKDASNHNDLRITS